MQFTIGSRALLALSLVPAALLLKGCGGSTSTAKPDVVGGETVTLANAKGPVYTSTVAITSTNEAHAGKSYCSGTVIDAARGLVLTAAHCFANANRNTRHYVFFGTHLSTRTSSQFRRISSYVMHADYDADLTVKAARQRIASHDIALVRFDGPIPAGFSAATLAETRTSAPNAFTLAGFGITGAFERSKSGRARFDEYGLPLTKSDTGTLRMVDVVKTSEYSSGKVINVAGKGGAAQGACPGDSGGPLYAETSGSWRLFGVLSTGVVGTADANGDGVAELGCVGQNTYTDVRGYASWIVQASARLRR